MKAPHTIYIPGELDELAAEAYQHQYPGDVEYWRKPDEKVEIVVGHVLDGWIECRLGSFLTPKGLDLKRGDEVFITISNNGLRKEIQRGPGGYEGDLSKLEG